MFWRFVLNFAGVAAPLKRKLEKDQPARISHLMDERFRAFDLLKKALLARLILELPKRKELYIFDTDRREYQLG